MLLFFYCQRQLDPVNFLALCLSFHFFSSNLTMSCSFSTYSTYCWAITVNYPIDLIIFFCQTNSIWNLLYIWSSSHYSLTLYLSNIYLSSSFISFSSSIRPDLQIFRKWHQEGRISSWFSSLRLLSPLRLLKKPWPRHPFRNLEPLLHPWFQWLGLSSWLVWFLSWFDITQSW